MGVSMKIWRWKHTDLAIASALTCQVVISACNPDQPVNQAAPADSVETTSEATSPAVACAPMDSQVPLQPATENELPFERFNFRPTAVEATDSTLTFKGSRYSFTFCKGDRTWGVEALEPDTREEDYEEYFAALSDPDYTTITSQNQAYQARVRLDAPWLEEAPASDNELEQVIFELIKPGDSQPTSQVLYTNTDIIERELGATVGVPTITGTVATDDALWWSIGFEQGEGATGIATVVQYQLDSNQIVLWQPSELGSVQITDLALTTTDDETILWLGTQYSGEGTPSMPAKGLVAYRPNTDSIETYTIENSPLIGGIPTRLWSERENLWVATANGVCEVDWAAIDTNNSWACWRFSTMADMPASQDLYASLLAETPMGQFDGNEPVEVLWLADTDISTPESSVRYEISYPPGTTIELSQGADYYVSPGENPEDGYFWWPGREWSWNGQRFVRPWDQVAANYVGGGPQGIGPEDYSDYNYVVDWQTMRGDLELLSLTPETTEITYFSAWVNGDEIEPWVTVTEVPNTSPDTTNPTEEILIDLKQAAR